MTKDPAFPDRLQRYMDDKRMTRADLARHIWGNMTDERGYTVPRNRQTISKYLSGKSAPSDTTVRLMAEALGVGYTDLMPNADPVNRPGSGIVMTAVGSSKYRLDLSLVVPADVAGKVISLISEYAK